MKRKEVYTAICSQRIHHSRLMQILDSQLHCAKCLCRAPGVICTCSLLCPATSGPMAALKVWGPEAGWRLTFAGKKVACMKLLYGLAAAGIRLRLRGSTMATMLPWSAPLRVKFTGSTRSWSAWRLGNCENVRVLVLQSEGTICCDKIYWILSENNYRAILRQNLLWQNLLNSQWEQ